MYSARSNKGHFKECLALIFEVNCGGLVATFQSF